MQDDAGNEDVIWFFRALGSRPSRRKLAEFMLDESNYKNLRDKYVGSSTWPNLIKVHLQFTFTHGWTLN